MAKGENAEQNGHPGKEYWGKFYHKHSSDKRISHRTKRRLLKQETEDELIYVTTNDITDLKNGSDWLDRMIERIRNS